MYAFEAAVWGTVGQWASAIGTTAAFSATFYVIRRDARVRRYAQSRKVAFYAVCIDDHARPEGAIAEESGSYRLPPGHLTWWELKTVNLSDEPIYKLTYLRREPALVIEMADVILPGKSWSTQIQVSTPPPRDTKVSFTDNSGKFWVRRLDGSLEEHPRKRVTKAPSK